MELPKITPTQSWACENGCGECKPVLRDIIVYEAMDADTGKLIHLETEPAWVSDCCEVELLLYDESISDFVDYQITK